MREESPTRSSAESSRAQRKKEPVPWNEAPIVCRRSSASETGRVDLDSPGELTIRFVRSNLTRASPKARRLVAKPLTSWVSALSLALRGKEHSVMRASVVWPPSSPAPDSRCRQGSVTPARAVLASIAGAESAAEDGLRLRFPGLFSLVFRRNAARGSGLHATPAPFFTISGRGCPSSAILAQQVAVTGL